MNKFKKNSKPLKTILEKEYKECIDNKMMSVKQISKIIDGLKTIK